ncbi:Notchless protein-like protein, partial [Bienertia sinuspersici]
LVSHVNFYPNGQWVASALFDKSVKSYLFWVMSNLWLVDSRLLLSGSKDPTLKIWNSRTQKLKHDFPSHAYEMKLFFAVYWSSNGEKVASGGRDRDRFV